MRMGEDSTLLANAVTKRKHKGEQKICFAKIVEIS